MQTITPCLWFDHEAEAAARCYVSLLPDSGIDHLMRHGGAGSEVHGQPTGKELAVDFDVAGFAFPASGGVTRSSLFHGRLSPNHPPLTLQRRRCVRWPGQDQRRRLIEARRGTTPATSTIPEEHRRCLPASPRVGSG